MTDKAYIVANKKQELDFLKKFERKDLVWLSGKNPTAWILSEQGLFNFNASFPYVLVERENKTIAWRAMEKLTDQTIVYDGRKEEKMYKVTQEFMNELIDWRDSYNLDAKTSLSYAFVDGRSISEFPEVIENWWVDLDEPIENNNRLIAIIQWLNGEDLFEVEAPHKFVVQSKEPDKDGDYWYVSYYRGSMHTNLYLSKATRFDTREEAQEWANSHQVVVEIDAEGNEVGE